MSNLEFSVQLEPPATDADECCRQLAAAVRQGGCASCAGQTIHVQAPDGRILAIVLPPGSAPGMRLAIKL